MRRVLLALTVMAAPVGAQQYPTEWRYLDVAADANGWRSVFREIATIDACRSMIGEVVETYLGGPEIAREMGIASSQIGPDASGMFHIRIEEKLAGVVGCTMSSDPALQALSGPEDMIAMFMDKVN
ncbi:hypothetical protein FLO80_01400 [Aquicoccus porphyridii]|uniref:Uncharacterized protein n=1 Tax=Aquicoccus porphyridii TaxID=1852029 RepID=A0A5A9ZUL6_9RHOB|nr:hypothetical protein [Aquicoccus porphyridii]KAA0920859.1 hypothetical protein FLO80_01400 [Aquicoccus porphyridii]